MTLLKLGMCPVLTDEVLQLFREHNVKSVSDLISADAEDLARQCGVSYKVILAIRKVLFAQYAAIPFSGTTLYQEVTASVAILPTGCQSIDRLLDGGLYTCELVEVTGGAKSGKTQFCLTMSAQVAMQSQQNVLYIDTTGGFSSERLRDILEERGCSPQATIEAMSLIQCRKLFDVFDLLEILEEIRGRLEDQNEDSSLPRVVIIDSVSALIAPLLGGNQVDGQSLMCHLAQSLKVLPVEFYISVLVTNSVVQGESPDEKKPSMGRSWLGVPHTRIMMKNTSSGDGADTPHKEHREAVLVKSQRQPTGTTVNFVISEKGLTDT